MSIIRFQLYRLVEGGASLAEVVLLVETDAQEEEGSVRVASCRVQLIKTEVFEFVPFSCIGDLHAAVDEVLTLNIESCRLARFGG